MEFHISRQVRDHYHFDQALFGYTGNAIFANFHATRVFAQKINAQRDLVNFPEQAVRAGQINAMGLIDEILHHVIALYRTQLNPNAFSLALIWLEESFGRSDLDLTLERFAAEFPPLKVYTGEETLSDYVHGSTTGTPNREILLEELLMLWVENRNPANNPYKELFDEKSLYSGTSYPHLINSLQRFFDTQPSFGPARLNLIDLLRIPAISVPYSLTGQLEYIRENWSEMLGRYLYRLLTSLDLVKEEERAVFQGPGPTLIPMYDEFAHSSSKGGTEIEREAFSPDQDWMPRLVLVAKNTYVWLAQLSKQYGRQITHLDQVPVDELALLASRGFTGLWLIGLWERSSASARIKQLCGNPEAIASAYSLHSYEISADLGGEIAFQGLREMAWLHGIRLASDMVPNHMGIDSRWVVDHPDWFVQLDYPPYPAYTFSGPDLSTDSNVGIFIEDHYYSRQDAAVVFRYDDHRDGSTRYIYHGNDGTTMPWNDTAQLNYLIPTVRESVIQTILSVARRFPIIRFDAAMTLAKRHYQRLWFPEPGSGGGIPSRAEHGLSKDHFNTVFPLEFWREVVDRVAKEIPDTLLLAEAFWLMEGYFVRTLGMHRVYNSAFMNMLRNEENAKYRTLIKTTLEFEPEILKRYVNFMNNPDERTAVDQFDKGDKYFGVCAMMATLPGLPMIGHGQVEGYTEKYGMEYRRAYWDEQPDQYLIDRHKREIFPLLHRRAIFGDVKNFLLYDFYTGNHEVDENVFAFTNRLGDERALVVYHNRFASTEGKIRVSSAVLTRDNNSNQYLSQRTLSEGLALKSENGLYIIIRDQITGLEHLFHSIDLAENGLHFKLNAYEHHVFIDFREAVDDERGTYHHLCEYLNGRGVPKIQEALAELGLQPVLGPYREILNPGYVNFLYSQRRTPAISKITRVDSHSRHPTQSGQINPSVIIEAKEKLTRLLDGIQQIEGHSRNRGLVLSSMGSGLIALLSLQVLIDDYPVPDSRNYSVFLKNLYRNPSTSTARSSSLDSLRWVSLIGWLFIRDIGLLSDSDSPAEVSRSWFEEWHFIQTIVETTRGVGLNADDANQAVTIVRLLLILQNWYNTLRIKSLRQMVSELLGFEEVRVFLGINRYKDVLWFNQEAFDEILWWMSTVAIIEALSTDSGGAVLLTERVLICRDLVNKLKKGAKAAEYQVDKLLAAL